MIRRHKGTGCAEHRQGQEKPSLKVHLFYPPGFYPPGPVGPQVQQLAATLAGPASRAGPTGPLTASVRADCPGAVQPVVTVCPGWGAPLQGMSGDILLIFLRPSCPVGINRRVAEPTSPVSIDYTPSGFARVCRVRSGQFMSWTAGRGVWPLSRRARAAPPRDRGGRPSRVPATTSGRFRPML